MEKAKRRFQSQKIGRSAELIFEKWANENGLVANKQDNDFGIDYICHEMSPVGKTGKTEEISGRTVAVQVKGVSATDRPRIRLDRTDVETALRLRSPYCAVAVEMTKSKVHFRFLDNETMEQWFDFLASTRQHITIRIDSMKSDAEEFIRDLHHVSRPIFQSHLAELKVLRGITAHAPGAKLSINRGISGESAYVKLPFLHSAFEIDTATEREAFANLLFTPQSLENIYAETFSRFALRPALQAISELIDGPIHLIAQTERSVELFVERDGQRITSTFGLRYVEGERAYIAKSGLVLRITEPQSTPSGKAHQLSFRLASEGAATLPDSDQIDFLRMLSPGALLNEVGKPGIKIEHLGIGQVGGGIQAIERVYKALELPMREVLLSDLADESFAVNIAVVDALIKEPVQYFPIPAFVFGLDEGEDIDETNWKPCEYTVPIVLKLKVHPFVFWLTGNGEGYIQHDILHGFRMGPPEYVEVETAAFEVPSGIIASAYFAKDWPAFPVNVVDENVKRKSNESLPIYGRYRRIDSH